MKKLFLVILGSGLLSVLFKSYKNFKSKYDFGIYYIDKNEEAFHEARMQEADEKARKLFFRPADYSNAMDLRGTPTHVCACGCEVWNLKVSFEDFQIANYFLDMECANCGSIATAPTPIDKEAN